MPPLFSSTASLTTGKELAAAGNIKALEVCRPVLTWHHVRAPILSTARGDEQAAGFPLSPLTHTMLIQKLREAAGIFVSAREDDSVALMWLQMS